MGSRRATTPQRRRPLPLLCPNSAEVRTYLQRWITTVAEVLQADAIFWDEPHFYIPLGESRTQGLWSCCCTRCQELFRVRYGQPLPPTETMEVRQCKQAAIAQLISDVTAIAAGHGLQNIVCILPEHDDLKGLQAKCDLLPPIPISTFSRLIPIPCGIAVILPPRRSSVQRSYRPANVITKPRRCGSRGSVCRPAGAFAGRGNAPDGQMWHCDIAIWSYLATAYMSSHTCADASRVWEVLTQTMQNSANPS